MTDLPIQFAGPEPVEQPQGHDWRPGCYGPFVRVMCRPGPTPSSELCVEVKDPQHSRGWRELRRFNDMADDYACVNAHNAALHARQQFLEGERP